MTTLTRCLFKRVTLACFTLSLLEAQDGSTCVCSVSIVSGTITELTERARQKTDLKEGDRVMALVGGGGYAG